MAEGTCRTSSSSKVKVFGCPMTGCTASLPDERSIKLHMSLAHSPSKYITCPMCSTNVDSEASMAKHFRLYHPSSPITLKSESKPKMKKVMVPDTVIDLTLSSPEENIGENNTTTSPQKSEIRKRLFWHDEDKPSTQEQDLLETDHCTIIVDLTIHRGEASPGTNRVPYTTHTKKIFHTTKRIDHTTKRIFPEAKHFCTGISMDL
ncbi:uncharacterized protein [Ptychodera flava]|uniref:uncharacterized protein n=1 Tax=Ptychodera flava TaxID=63121 RepID=UPI00396A9820